MNFFKTLFANRNKNEYRRDIKRYVDVEYRPAERASAYHRIVTDNGPYNTKGL